MIAGVVAASMARRRQQQRQRQKEQQRRREQQRKREQARRLQLRDRQRQEEQQQRNHNNHNKMSLTSSFLDPDEIEAFVQEYNARRYSLANLEDEVEFLEQINALEVDFLRMFDATHRSSSSEEEEDEEQEEAAYVQDRYNDFSFDIPTATVVATAEIVAEGHGGEEVVGEHIVQATEVVEQGQGHDYGTDYSPVPVTLPIIRGHKSSVCAIQ